LAAAVTWLRADLEAARGVCSGGSASRLLLQQCHGLGSYALEIGSQIPHNVPIDNGYHHFDLQGKLARPQQSDGLGAVREAGHELVDCRPAGGL